MRYLFAVLVFLAGCTKTETPPVVSAPESVRTDLSLRTIEDIGAKSSCAKVQWKDRGLVKEGFARGMALSYAKSLCKPIPTVALDSTGAAGDVLTHYAQIFKDLGMTNKNGLDTNRHMFTLAMGLGARESNGQYCAGRDASMDFTEHDSAEAGIMQTSWNIINYKAESKKLFEYYKSNPDKCFLDAYKVGVTKAYCDKNAKIWGTGPGTEYQKLAKACPAMAVETALITLRFSGGVKSHYGPIRSRAAQVKTECETMFKQVQDEVTKNLGYCDLLR